MRSIKFFKPIATLPPLFPRHEKLKRRLDCQPSISVDEVSVKEEKTGNAQEHFDAINHPESGNILPHHVGNTARRCLRPRKGKG